MNRTTAKFDFLIFLYGLGSSLNFFLVGALSFTELFCFAIAPLLLLKYVRELQRNMIMGIVYFPVGLIIGCAIVYLFGGMNVLKFLKNSGIYYSIFAQTLVLYFLFSRSPKGLKWYFIGVFLSSIVSMFVFNTHIESVDGNQIVTTNDLSLEEQMDGILFWVLKINALLTLPSKGWYFQVPLAYSGAIGFVCMAICFLISSSGRSAGAFQAVGSCLILLCGKSRRKMAKLGRHFIKFAIIGLLALIAIKNLYVFTASHGYLGEDAQKKYYVQVRNTSLLGVLMGGRSGFFIAFRAIWDHPILGFVEGWRDRKGYVGEFMNKYGTNEDLQYYVRYTAHLRSQGEEEQIPNHSSLMQFWGNSGIIGLIFWLWVLYLIFLYYKKYAWAVPQWFGVLAFTSPAMVFTIFFNPYQRTMLPPILACLLIARAIGKGRTCLSAEMEEEARRYD